MARVVTGGILKRNDQENLFAPGSQENVEVISQIISKTFNKPTTGLTILLKKETLLAISVSYYGDLAFHAHFKALINLTRI